jgi:hypothetical protein
MLILGWRPHDISVTVAAGDVAVPAALMLENDSTAPTTAVTVCNFGDRFRAQRAIPASR